MKKEISLRLSLMERARLFVGSQVESLAKFVSFCVEEDISSAQVWRILHAVLAFTVLVFSHTHALLSVLFLFWFALTLWDCRKSLTVK